MNNIEIGKRIHNARTLRKYTLDEVAKKLVLLNLRYNDMKMVK